MSESKSELDEMEQNNYSINSNTMDPKNNEELIIYVSFHRLFTLNILGSLSYKLLYRTFRCRRSCKMSRIDSSPCQSRSSRESMTWEIGKQPSDYFISEFLPELPFTRIDDLEKSISDLMTQAGVEGHQHEK